MTQINNLRHLTSEELKNPEKLESEVNSAVKKMKDKEIKALHSHTLFITEVDRDVNGKPIEYLSQVDHPCI